MTKNYILFMLMLILGVALIFLNMKLPTTKQPEKPVEPEKPRFLREKEKEEETPEQIAEKAQKKLEMYKNIGITVGIVMVILAILYMYSKWMCDCGENSMAFLNKGINFYLMTYMIIGIFLIVLYAMIIAEMNKAKIKIDWIPIAFLIAGVLTTIVPIGYYFMNRNSMTV